MGLTFGSVFSAAMGVVAALAILEVFIDIVLIVAICIVASVIRRKLYGPRKYRRHYRRNRYNYCPYR
jgi:hypothetical protein